MSNSVFIPNPVMDRMRAGEPDSKQQFDTLGLEDIAMKPEDFAKFVARESATTIELPRRIRAARS